MDFSTPRRMSSLRALTPSRSGSLVAVLEALDVERHQRAVVADSESKQRVALAQRLSVIDSLWFLVSSGRESIPQQGTICHLLHWQLSQSCVRRDNSVRNECALRNISCASFQRRSHVSRLARETNGAIGSTQAARCCTVHH